MLPSLYAVNYDALLADVRDRCVFDVSSFLEGQLPGAWRDAYLTVVTHEPNLVRCRHRSFEYICDLYSQLEMTGSVPYDQTIADRVIGVWGRSSRTLKERDARRIRIELSEELEGAERDDGHFMARSIGGGVDLNLFSQERRLNRGWSSQGKIYRRMEKYCSEQNGTFCFSRPIYSDGGNVPRWLEFGVLKADGTLWVEDFDN